MFGLHHFDMYYFEYMYDYEIFSEMFPNFMSFTYFTMFSIVVFTNFFFSMKLNKVIKNMIFTVILFSVMLLWFMLMLKLYMNFNLFYNVSASSWINIPFKNTLGNTSPLGDTLVMLCLTTSMITWVFLGESYLNFKNTNMMYFGVFIVFTINMVNSDNIFTMFIFFEFMFLPSLFFVYILGYSKKVEKTMKYLLIWTYTGSFMVLMTMSYLYSITGYLDFDYIKYAKFSAQEITLLYLGFFLGFGVKMPLWPFHYWLTKVHVEAPTGFSMFLSGFLVKTALFCLLITINLFKTKYLIIFSLTVMVWGAMDASVSMWTSTDMKSLIAFATMQEMNLMMLFVLLTNYTHYQMLNSFMLIHGMLSALFFFLVDQVQKSFQTRNLNNLGGLGTKAGFLMFIIWLALLMFSGFPMFSKFMMEWELMTLLYENFSWFGMVIFFFVSFFGVIGFFSMWFMMLYGQPTMNLVKTMDMLKMDKVMSLFLMSLLTLMTYLYLIF